MLMLIKLSTKLFVLLACLFSFTIANAQDKKLSGKVVDEKGMVLPGVSVSIKEANSNTITDQSGIFTLNAPLMEKH